jgi:hypothetical protein
VNSSGRRTPTERIETKSTEEYEDTACEDLICDLKTLYVL